jgi:hypothetical protein
MTIFINIYISKDAEDIAPEAFLSKEVAIAEAKGWLLDELHEEHEDLQVLEEYIGSQHYTYIGDCEADHPYCQIYERSYVI